MEVKVTGSMLPITIKVNGMTVEKNRVILHSNFCNDYILEKEMYNRYYEWIKNTNSQPLDCKVFPNRFKFTKLDGKYVVQMITESSIQDFMIKATKLHEAAASKSSIILIPKPLELIDNKDKIKALKKLVNANLIPMEHECKYYKYMIDVHDQIYG